MHCLELASTSRHTSTTTQKSGGKRGACRTCARAQSILHHWWVPKNCSLALQVLDFLLHNTTIYHNFPILKLAQVIEIIANKGYLSCRNSLVSAQEGCKNAVHNYTAMSFSNIETFSENWIKTGALFQYPMRRLIVRSRKVSRPRDLYL